MQEYLWFIYAFMAAVAWGLGYVFEERLLHVGVSPFTLVFAQSLLIFPIYVVLWLKFGSIQNDVGILLSDKTYLFYLVIASVCIIFGSLLILFSVSEKNATMTSIVEISYPFFVGLFAWLIFRDTQVNLSLFLGGLFIFSGVILILRNN
ncbi:MAG: EamA family transporter [Rhodospirillales bacterium]|nr:EamA family transporter [Rhodospirillales bacterium]